MRETTFTELRKHAKNFFDAVEEGEVVRVYRKGKAVADIIPISKEMPSWKRELPSLTVKGLSLTQEILKDRNETDS